MKKKMFVIVYICLVCIFIAANELILNLSGTARTGIVFLFLIAAFAGRRIQEKK